MAAWARSSADFIAFSTVKHVPVSILVHLGSIDFDEYLGRKGK